MELEPLALILNTLGEIIIGYSVIRVHSKVRHEHRIDQEVLDAMRREKWWAISGIVLIIVGFVVEWVAQRGFPALL